MERATARRSRLEVKFRQAASSFVKFCQAWGLTRRRVRSARQRDKRRQERPPPRCAALRRAARRRSHFETEKSACGPNPSSSPERRPKNNISRILFFRKSLSPAEARTRPPLRGAALRQGILAFAGMTRGGRDDSISMQAALTAAGGRAAAASALRPRITRPAGGRIECAAVSDIRVDGASTAGAPNRRKHPKRPINHTRQA